MRRKVLASLVTDETKREHRAKWFVHAGAYGQRLVKIQHTSSMRGHWPGYDVECYCGWASKTGGAIKARVAEALTHHRLHEQWKADNGWQGLDDAEIGRRITAQPRQEETPRALADRLRAAQVRVLAPDVGACPVARVAPRGVVRSLLR
jgi:hypothetical protein